MSSSSCSGYSGGSAGGPRRNPAASSLSSTTQRSASGAGFKSGSASPAGTLKGSSSSSGHSGSAAAATEEGNPLGCFGRYLSLYVLACIVSGTAIGAAWPSIATALNKLTVAEVNVAMAVLLWVMVAPMMMGVDLSSLREVFRSPRGLILTTAVNWLIQPFLMFAVAYFFFKVVFVNVIDDASDDDDGATAGSNASGSGSASGGTSALSLSDEYLAGAVILGGSPCTAMVFVWSALADGNASYTLTQVSLNNILLLFLYVPTAVLLLGIGSIALPWDTVFLSVGLFLVVPAIIGLTARAILLRKGGLPLVERGQAVMKPFTIVALLATLVLIFIFQGEKIVGNWTHILIIAVPLVIQVAIVFGITGAAGYSLRVPYDVLGPATFVGSSNFFELAVAVAATTYGLDSGAALATVVGVLVEVPLMLTEVQIIRRLRTRIEARVADKL